MTHTPTQTKITQNKRKIRGWIEERGGKPVRVKGTASQYDMGLLRIDFPSNGPNALFEPISWEDFFRQFDDHALAFLYQEHTNEGTVSRFFKFVHRENSIGAENPDSVDDEGESSSPEKKPASKKSRRRTDKKPS